MTNDDKLLTVAIHSYERALQLKTLLESEGIPVVLRNVNLSQPVVLSGVRVRIKESDLPQALRIIENAEIFQDNRKKEIPVSKTILVPVDFSDYSLNAVLYAFHLASKFKSDILLLHSFVNPALIQRVQVTDVLTFDLAESQEIDKKLMGSAEHSMELFSGRIRDKIKKGEIPPVVFRSKILEGVPEDVISETAKSISPLLIVMGTRGIDRKEQEMIGSVTAEVLDACRFPVFTVPEKVSYQEVIENENVLFFCNMEQEDIIAMDTFHRFFPEDPLKILLATVPARKFREDSNQKVAQTLATYFSNLYLNYKFCVEKFRISNAAEDVNNILTDNEVKLIVLPNKKRNVFARFFNPGIAHKLLLHTDTPMLVIPV